MPGTKTNTNRRILRILLDIKNRVIDAEVKLLVNGKNDDAKKLAEGIDNLDKIIRQLRGKILDDWLTKVDDFRTKLGIMNAEVQEAIDDIKDDIETAKRVVKLIGYVDKVVELAGKVMI